MYHTMKQHQIASPMEVMLTPIVCSDISFSCLLRRAPIVAMLAYSLYQIAMAPWFQASTPQDVSTGHVLGLMCALMATLFLTLSRSQAWLNLMSRSSDAISAEMIGKVYLVFGSLCFVLSLAL